MRSRFTWDETKRVVNLAKHRLDFADASLVLDSEFRLDVESVRNGEERLQSFAYVFDQLAVLTVVHLARELPQIISFRIASTDEREVYHEWLENDYTT